MVFSSYLFLFYFLPVALLVYYVAPRRARHLTLTIASYVFYGWANPLFLPLLLASTVVDYVVGLVLARDAPRDELERRLPLEPRGPRSRTQRLALLASICTNLGLLGFFKYFNFASESLDGLVTWLGVPELRLDLVFRVTLPLGISFYTFSR